MIITNEFNPTNWTNRRFFTIILFLYSIMFGLIYLQFLGLDIFIIRPVVGFFFILSVPGILILRIMKMKEINSIDSILLCIGSSLAVWMFLGFFINFIFPLLKYQNPISEIPFIISITIVGLLLSIGCYYSNPKSNVLINDGFDLSISPKILISLIIPFLSIFGTFLATYYNNRTLLFVLFLIVAFICIIIGYSESIKLNSHYFLIYIIGISLLWYSSLYTPYIWGWDNIYEYSLSNLVIQNHFWDTSIVSTVNAMLSIVILNPLFSIFCNLNSVWVYKIIYAALFAFVPVIIYRIFEIQTNKTIALFASLYFMFEVSFYQSLFTLGRQQIAEIFLALFLLVLVHEKITQNKKSILLIIFGFSVIVSHYGTADLMIPVLLIALGLYKLLDFAFIKITLYQLSAKIKHLFPLHFKLNNDTHNNHITIILIFLLFIFAYLWFSLLSSSESFFSIINVFSKISKNFVTDFASPKNAEGLSMVTQEMNRINFLHIFNAIMLYFNQILIIIGILSVFIIRLKCKINKEFYAISVIFLGLLFATMFVPFFASSLMLYRIYHISLIVLSVFFVIGFMMIFQLVSTFKGNQFIDMILKRKFLILSLYLAVFLLFQSGFFFQLIEGSSLSPILDPDVDLPQFNMHEVFAATWFYSFNDVFPIYADGQRWYLLASFNYNKEEVLQITRSSQIERYSYIFVGTKNLIQNKINPGNQYNSIDLNLIVHDRNKLYSNRKSEIFYVG